MAKRGMAKKERFYPIGLKLISIVSAILAVSLGGLTFLSTLFYSADIERTIMTNTMERAGLISRDIESNILSSVNSGRIICATLLSGSGSAGIPAGTAESLLGQNPGNLAVWSLTRRGKSFSVSASIGDDSRLAREGMRLPGREAFLSSHAEQIGRAFFGEIVLINASSDLGAPALALAFPNTMKNDSEAETVGLVFSTAEQTVSALSSRELYANYLVDSAGSLVAHPDGTVALALPSMKDEEIVRDALLGQARLKQMRYRDRSGKVFIGSYQKFLSGSLVVVSTVDRDVALAGVIMLQRRNLLITVMILSASMLLLFLFSRTLTEPVKTLVNGVDRIRDGDYSFTIEPRTRDEIGRLTASFNGMTKGLDERDRMKTAFGKFVNKQMAERVLQGDVALGGESRTAAVFFSDIRSFTALSEKMTPTEVVNFLNEYMTVMVKRVEDHHGIVDKFIGDSIMAIWGVPDSFGNDTENAVNAALSMRAALGELNIVRKVDGKPGIRIGCGINTGEVVAGQIGSLERMEYTCIGDSVNLASRIESLNKLFHTDILISEHSQNLVRTIFRVEPMMPIRVKGKEEVQQVYAVLGRFDDPNHFRSIEDLRSYLGIEGVSFDRIDPDVEEQKYEVVK